MRIRPILLAAAALLLAVPGAGAQSLPENGDFSVSLALFEPDDGTTFELKRMFGDRINLGLLLRASSIEIDTDLATVVGMQTQERSAGSFAVGPVIQWYGDRSRPVSPFLRGELLYGVSDSSIDQNGELAEEQEISRVEAALSLGAEWFPLRWLGLSGHTGVRWARDDLTIDSPVTDLSGEQDTTEFTTFRSGIAVNFYFR